MTFEYEKPSRPDVVEFFNGIRSDIELRATTQCFLLLGSSIQGHEEHQAFFVKMKRFISFLSPSDCWGVASLSQIKSELCTFAYDIGFAKAGNSRQ